MNGLRETINTSSRKSIQIYFKIQFPIFRLNIIDNSNKVDTNMDALKQVDN